MNGWVSCDVIYAAIALLAIGSAVYLIRKARRVCNLGIVSAALPRLYLGALYLILIAIELPTEDGRMFVRFGILIWLVIENLNHALEWLGQTKRES